MPHLTINRSDLTPEQVATALRQELGERYKVTVPEGSGDRLRVETSTLAYANVHMKKEPDGTRLNVHGGGIVIGRIINEYTIARKVTEALRSAPGLAAEA